jgi:ribosomal protein S18 acetylase RimI-like enzyme
MAPARASRARRPFTAERFLMEQPRLRPAVESDLPFLWEMLHEAAAVRHELRALPKSEVLGRHSVARYLSGWGRPGDVALVALGADGHPVGAAWRRLFPARERGVGVVALPGVPEIAIAVRAGHRGLGIGSALLTALMDEARSAGITRLALSVDPDNPAVRLYRRLGFREVGREAPRPGSSVVMIADLEAR